MEMLFWVNKYCEKQPTKAATVKKYLIKRYNF